MTCRHCNSKSMFLSLIFLVFYPIRKFFKFSLNLTFVWKCMCKPLQITKKILKIPSHITKCSNNFIAMIMFQSINVSKIINICTRDAASQKKYIAAYTV